MFIADMHGQAKPFFTYQAVWEMLEFHAEVKKAIIAKTQSKKDASDNLRRFLISNMAYGR